MRFGKIDYINLLPFYVFFKRYPIQTRYKATSRKKSGAPSAINAMFKKRQIEAGFISSIAAKKGQGLNAGIIAHKEVWSVIIIPGMRCQDTESATSNKLADVLGLQGCVLIGDKALKHYLQGKGDFIDMARVWYEREGLPFVFGRLCVNANQQPYKKMSDAFLRSRIKIPAYILSRYAKKTGICEKQILRYLTKIHYRIDSRCEKSLKRFNQKVRLLQNGIR